MSRSRFPSPVEFVWSVLLLASSSWLSATPALAINPRYGQFPVVSSSGRYVAFSCDDEAESCREITIWDLQTGAEVQRIGPPDGSRNRDVNSASLPRFRAVAISEEADLIATIQEMPTGNGRFPTTIWSLSTGEPLWRKLPPAADLGYGSTYQTCFSPDGDRVVSLVQKQLTVRRASDGTELLQIPVEELNYPSMMRMSPDGARLYFLEGRSEQYQAFVPIRCRNSTDGSVVGEFRFTPRDPSSQAPIIHGINSRSGLFDVGQDFLVELCKGPEDSYLVVWDAQRYTELRRIPLGWGRGGYYKFSRPSLLENRGSCLITSESNASTTPFAAIVREYDLRTGEQIGEHPLSPGLVGKGDPSVTLVPGTSTFCWTQMALGSQSGSSANTLFLGKYVPQGSRNAVLSFQPYVGRRNSAVILSGAARGVVSGEPFEVFCPTPTLGKAANVARRPREYWNLKATQPTAIRSDPVAVLRALNDLRQPLPKRGGKAVDPSKPRLFLFAVGISKYEFEEYNLSYSSVDAQSLAARFEQEHDRLYGDVQVKLLVDQKATPAAIQGGLDWLQRSSTEKDLVIVFFSGHGLRAKRGLYYFTHHGDEENIHNTCVNWSDVAASLAATQAAQILFLSDCCHAGSFSQDRYVNQKEIASLIAARENIAIFASSTGDEVSFELGAWRHGAFTYALLEALNGKADEDESRKVDWEEMIKYVQRRVPEITRNRQHPTVLKPVRPEVVFPLSSITDPEISTPDASAPPAGTAGVQSVTD